MAEGLSVDVYKRQAQGLDEDTAWEQAMAWVDTDEVHDEIYGLAETMAETTAERTLPSYLSLIHI